MRQGLEPDSFIIYDYLLLFLPKPMLFHPLTVQTRTTTPLGDVRLAASPKGLSGLWFAWGERYVPFALLDGKGTEGEGAWPQDPQHPVLQAAVAQLDAYFSGTCTQFDIPLDVPTGTPFQKAVWQALQSIPYGQTITYGQLSAQIGRPAAVRAVGSAIGRNPISIMIPCHRVMGKNGSLTGYGGGLERKAALLQLEGVSQAG